MPQFCTPRRVLYAAAMLTATACSTGNHSTTPDSSAHPAGLLSGLQTQYVDDAVRPQDDLYRHLNGKWLDTFEIPADKGLYGAFTLIDDQSQEQLRAIVESLTAASAGTPASTGTPATAGEPGGDPPGGDPQKVADLYASFMDEPRLEALGLKPLEAQFAEIDALADKRDIPALIARFNRMGAGAPYDIDINPDAKDSTRYAAIISQGGLGLPDRDYYLKDDPKLKEARGKYLLHVEKMLAMAGVPHPGQSAADILKLETSLAEIQWTRVANRDPEKTYNKIPMDELGALMPGYDWPRYLEGSGLRGKTDYVIVRQPSYFRGLDKLMADTPLAVWKSYFKWHQLAYAAPYLSKAFVDERFAFTGTNLRGIPQNQPRWKRGIAVLDFSIGEAIGRLYVARYFPPRNKARMEELVRNLLEAYRRDIDTLDWMSPETKKGAREKLAKIVTKIGYPATWRDYGTLQIARDDLWGNVLRAAEFEHRRGVAKLGKPIDRAEWHMTPQTVNAYYNPVMNEIVFPAAILQPPFFDAAADDAVNYGGIVAVIGHEVSHGFDDKGSQYDAEGNLRDWFTQADHAKFAAKTKALIAQYNAYEPVSGYHVNGELTLGENIGDNSGLAVAYKAYQLSLSGRTPPVIDGFTGEQRFYLGWVQVWRGKVREDEAVQRIKTDPHAPPAVRGTAPLLNQTGFYAAFGIKPGDKMYRPPEQRVSVW
ncbi:MAG: putative endopeptidase [Gammaproteobacteria bacterium]|jgi:putative endopeptidase|nr:putative endopeptidase [Gammaproteobacteria bacterium]